MIIDQTSPIQLNGDYVRDESTQANELAELLTILEGEGVSGLFVFTFVSPALFQNENPRKDLDMGSYSLVKSYADKYGICYPDMPWEPKESFRAVANYFLDK